MSVVKSIGPGSILDRGRCAENAVRRKKRDRQLIHQIQTEEYSHLFTVVVRPVNWTAASRIGMILSPRHEQ